MERQKASQSQDDDRPVISCKLACLYFLTIQACVDDLPHSPIIEVYRALAAQGYEIWIVSGRSDEVLEQTTEWLKRHVGFPHKLIMRQAGDHTPDTALKRSWVEDGTIPKDRVLVVFEDRANVVTMWREIGLTCLQVTGLPPKGGSL